MGCFLGGGEEKVVFFFFALFSKESPIHKGLFWGWFGDLKMSGKKGQRFEN